MALAKKEPVLEAPPSVRAPRRRAYSRKTDIVLVAAERAFLEAGYANTSMDTVAEQAGVSKRTVYSNFGSKQDLFAAVIRKRCADVLPHALEGIDLATRDPEAALGGLAVAFLKSIFSRPQIELFQTVVAESRQFPEIGRIMFEGPIRESQHPFAKFFRVQAELGQMEFPEIDLAPAQFIALLKTDLHMRLLFNQDRSICDEVIVRSAEASVQLFLKGARSVKARAPRKGKSVSA